MSFTRRIAYYRRIARTYLLPGNSNLTFWHDTPAINSAADPHTLAEYYMQFEQKADYPGPFDDHGIPLLNYRGRIGRQYNPIAIAQWGLGNYNRFRRHGNVVARKKFVAASDWLCAHLEQNPQGVWVWNHHFDWDYRTPLRAPWYSALAQGQGVSLLLRSHQATQNPNYLEAAKRAFTSFLRPMEEGGVTFTDAEGNLWFEEYIVSPPTHILNGFIWAVWGVYDYFQATKDAAAGKLFEAAVRTLEVNLHRYDLGFWSRYELSGTFLPMVASAFYHRLHIVQLRVLHRLTGRAQFARVADQWDVCARRSANYARALCYKSAFKLCYY